MIAFKIILIGLLITICQCRQPDQVYCVNQDCSGPISKAKTLITYNSGDEDLMSFRGNADATIYMKSAGTNSDLWFAEINGQTGFVNSKFLREYKIIEKHPQFIVPVDAKNKQEVKPDKVQQAHEVFEGTTIFSTEAPASPPQPSPTATPITEAVETSTPIAEFQQETTQNINDNDLNKISSDILNNFEIILNQNIDDNPTLTDSKEILGASEENSEILKSQTDVPLLASTTERPVENIDLSASSEEQTNILPQNNQFPLESPESLPSPEPVVSSISENIIVPENIINAGKVDNIPKSIENPDTTTPNESNTSLPSNTINNEQSIVQPLPEIPNEPNVPSPQNMFITAPPNNENVYVTAPPNNENVVTPQVPELSIPNQQENNLLNNINLEDRNLNGAHIPDVPVAVPKLFDTIPPAFVNTETVSTTPAAISVADAQTIPASTEANYVPTTETIPVNMVESMTSAETNTESFASQEEIITSTESVPTQSSDDYTSVEEITTPTTLPTEQESPPVQAYEDITQSTPQKSIESALTTESLPSSTTELPNDNVYSTTEPPTSEENNEGLLSNIYSTLADLWPSSTEAPPPETIFNPDYIHKDVPEELETSDSFSFMAYIISSYKSVMGSREESRALFATPGETCYRDEYCDGESTENKNRLLTFLVTTAVSVLLFTLGYYYIDNRRQDSRLIGTINSLQRDLLFSTKECEILKEELTSTKSKLAGIEDNSFGMDDMVLSLKEEINELKAQNERLRKSLDDNEKLLRVSENTASELQNTLSDMENTLSELLVERASTEEHIAELNGKIQAFEEELISVSRDRDNFQLKYVSAESAVEETKKQRKQIEELNKKLSDAQDTIELQKHEITALKDVVKELKSGAPSDVDVNSLLDHTEIKAKLSKATEEKETYMTKYELEHNERVRLTRELAGTQESLQTTTQQATEAFTRLEVLGKYFQQRESELMKELTAKESLWLSKQGESTSTIEKMEILQQEAQRYKEKCDALTLELAEQESMRRTAISEIESRAHTAWLEARQAKRDADAAKEEAAALRRKLASLHQADGAASPHRPVASPLEMVDSGMLPPPMLPLSFMPPPILPPLPRPPPLGRLPSPRPSRYDREYAAGKRYTPGPHADDSPPYPARYSPPAPRDAHSPAHYRYPPPADYIPRSIDSEREYDRRDRGSAECSPHERGSSWERERYTETEYHSDSPSRRRRRRRRYARVHSGPSSASSHTESDDSGK